MNKSNDEHDQQNANKQSALFRLWNRFKEKKIEEQKKVEDVSIPKNTECENAQEDNTIAQPTVDESAQDFVNEQKKTAVNQAESTVAVHTDTEQEPPMESQSSKVEPSEQSNEPVDAKINLTISKDHMTATATVTPPKNGGAEITEEMIHERLKEKGVLEEFFNSGIKMLCTFKLYNKPADVAKAKPAIDGKDGFIEELFKREHTICLETDENGLVNYKNLNNLRIVKKGTVICKITLPESSVDGRNLFGKTVHGRPGKAAKVRIGKNMTLSEDGTELSAACDGNLCYHRDAFFVDDVLHIPADVDNAIGNIDFCGDIIIDGGVREGFSVKSDKNITINGAVEGAFINAKGKIILKKGINGMGRGLLKADGDIRSKFLENCMVNSAGSVITECIINSRVTAEDEIIVENGKGTIVGGVCTARNKIKAKYIGSPASVETKIVLGASPDVISQKIKLVKKIEEAKKKIDNLEKNCAYLERASKKTSLSKARASQLSQMKKQRMMLSIQTSIDTKQLIELDGLIESLDSCQLTCLQIYPPVKILMANESLQIKQKESHRLYFYKNGEIKEGSI